MRWFAIGLIGLLPVLVCFRCLFARLFGWQRRCSRRMGVEFCCCSEREREMSIGKEREKQAGAGWNGFWLWCSCLTSMSIKTKERAKGAKGVRMNTIQDLIRLRGMCYLSKIARNYSPGPQFLRCNVLLDGAHSPYLLIFQHHIAKR